MMKQYLSIYRFRTVIRIAINTAVPAAVVGSDIDTFNSAALRYLTRSFYVIKYVRWRKLSLEGIAAHEMIYIV